VRLLLSLPRLASSTGLVDRQVALPEADRLAARLAARTAAFAAWQDAPRSGLRASDLALALAAEDDARTILERFHYLESFRPGSEHYTGTIDGQIAALLTVSPLDLEPIQRHLPSGVSPCEVAVLARVFSFDWAPKNTLSFLMARLAQELRARARPPRLLLTYLNPNVGFTGASYRAANWRLWARERGTRYSYLDNEYITDRALARRFGTANESRLQERLGDRVVFSRMVLDPLELYAYPSDAGMRAALAGGPLVEFGRPEL
jgi:hypothetical protein